MNPFCSNGMSWTTWYISTCPLIVCQSDLTFSIYSIYSANISSQVDYLSAAASMPTAVQGPTSQFCYNKYVASISIVPWTHNVMWQYIVPHCNVHCFELYLHWPWLPWSLIRFANYLVVYLSCTCHNCRRLNTLPCFCCPSSSLLTSILECPLPLCPCYRKHSVGVTSARFPGYSRRMDYLLQGTLPDSRLTLLFFP